MSNANPKSPAGGTRRVVIPGLLTRWQMVHGRKVVILLPYLWLLLFMLPFLIVFKISLAEMARAIPPYTDLVSWLDGTLSISLNPANFIQLLDDPLYIEAYLQSLQVAAVSTCFSACCWVIPWLGRWRTTGHPPVTFCCYWLFYRHGPRF